MTATARKIDQSESLSTLQITIRSVEQMIEHLYFIAGQWLGVDASAVSVSIGDDLSVANEPNPTNALLAMVESGLMTDEQAVQEAKRQGILSSYFELSEDRPRAQEPEETEDEVVNSTREFGEGEPEDPDEDNLEEEAE